MPPDFFNPAMSLPDMTPSVWIIDITGGFYSFYFYLISFQQDFRKRRHGSILSPLIIHISQRNTCPLFTWKPVFHKTTKIFPRRCSSAVPAQYRLWIFCTKNINIFTYGRLLMNIFQKCFPVLTFNKIISKQKHLQMSQIQIFFLRPVINPIRFTKISAFYS